MSNIHKRGFASMDQNTRVSIAAKGGNATATKFGPNYMAHIGRRGGRKTQAILRSSIKDVHKQTLLP